jgi:hypothetical protein
VGWLDIAKSDQSPHETQLTTKIARGVHDLRETFSGFARDNFGFRFFRPHFVAVRKIASLKKKPRIAGPFLYQACESLFSSNPIAALETTTDFQTASITTEVMQLI